MSIPENPYKHEKNITTQYLPDEFLPQNTFTSNRVQPQCVSNCLACAVAADRKEWAEWILDKEKTGEIILHYKISEALKKLATEGE